MRGSEIQVQVLKRLTRAPVCCFRHCMPVVPVCRWRSVVGAGLGAAALAVAATRADDPTDPLVVSIRSGAQGAGYVVDGENYEDASILEALVCRVQQV